MGIPWTNASGVDKPGPPPSPDITLDDQLEELVFPPKDERKMSLPFNLVHQTSLLTLGLSPTTSPDMHPAKGAADVSHADETTKTTFSTLPAELRVKIYEMTWEPRRVTLTRFWLAGPNHLLEYEFYARTSDANIYDFFDEDRVTTTTMSTAQLPVTLWINSESRYETLRHYEIAFACPKNGDSKVYFNFEIDELEIRRHGALRSIISGEDLAKVKALIVPMGHKEARSTENTLDKWRGKEPVGDLDAKLNQLHTRGLSSGLEPYDPQNPFEDTELRRIAESLQREIAEAQGLPPKLLSVCPNLERVQLKPIVTCGLWPTENFATMDDEDDWFLKGNSECLTCTFHWTARHLGFLVADDPEEQVWSVGDICPPEVGVDREVRLGQVTIS